MSDPRRWTLSQVARLLLIALVISGLILPAQAEASPVISQDNLYQSTSNTNAIMPKLATTNAPTSYHKLIVDTEDKATLAQVAASGGILLEDYGSFSLWKVADTQVNRLSKLDKVEARDDLDEIGLRSGVVNTVKGVGAVPATLSQVKANGYQMWMIQFVGPVKSEWLKDLQSSNIQLVSYMPSNAYVVWTDLAGVSKLESMVGNDPNVQWTGAYHPAYRLAPSLQPGGSKISKAADQSVDVTIQFFKNDKVQDSINRLLVLSGKVYKSPSEIVNLNLFDVSLQVPAGQLVTLANWADVFNIEPWSAPKRLDEAQGQILAGNLTMTSGNVVPNGPGYLAWLASKGFPTDPAQYPLVDVVDDGIDNGSTTPLHPDFYQLGSTSNPARLVINSNCTVDASGDGLAGHGNINAGIAGGYNDKHTVPYTDTNGFNRGLGISPYTRLAGTKIFNNAGNYDISTCSNTDQGVVAKSYSNGAAITSNSWGNSDVAGGYDASAQAYDALTRDASSATGGNQQILHVFSAGNDGGGAQTIGSPGTAKNVLTVGATENVRDDGVADGCNYTGGKSADNIGTFSSRGPTTDLRVKPDIMAPGTHVQGPASQDPGYDGTGVCGASGSNNRYYPTGQTLYTWSTGTSHSAPAVAGSASLVYNYYKRVLAPGQNPSPAMLKGLLLNTPRYLNGTGTGGTLPNNNQGWGDVNMAPLFDASNHYCTLLDQSTIFTATGQTYSKTCQVNTTSKPVNITLAWTDAPGSTTGNAYVNNLDLEVTINGKIYKGNNFSGQYSATGGSADVRNNVENVFLPAGTTGTFAVKVKASNLAGDGVPGSGNTTDQDFALIVYNAEAGFSSALVGANGVTFQDPLPNGNNNQVIEPGEKISLTLGLQNSGNLAASGISSTVQSSTPGVTMVNSGSTYPDLNVNASADNNTPYIFSVSPGFTCGNLISFTQSVNFTGGQSFSNTFGLQTGSPAVVSNVFSSTDIPKNIPDGNTQGVTSTLTISGVTNPIGKIRVRINATHTWDGDLSFTLTSPTGSVLNLIVNRGGSGDNFTNTVLDDSAATYIGGGTAPFTGLFKPEEPLSVLNGQSANGTWKLNVADREAPDTGILNSWAILYDSFTYSCASFGAASSLTVAGYPSPVSPGTPNNFTVTAKDVGGNVVTGYTGTVTFSSSDGGATLPTNYTFQISDHGVHTFTATLANTGTRSITATDTGNNSITGSQTGIVVANCQTSVVNSNIDTGSGVGCGTLSYALTHASSGTTITFNQGMTISVSAALPAVPAGVNLNGGSCTAGPAVILDGTGTSAATNGLVLSGGSTLQNLKVTHFGGKQIVANGGGNRLGLCVIAAK